MSDFVSMPLAKIKNRRNIMSRLEKLERKTSARRSMQSDDLSNIASDITGVNFWAIDPNSGTVRMVMSGEDLYGFYGVHAHLVGLSADGTVQVFLSADDGTIGWGGGEGQLNVNGVEIQIPAAATPANSINFVLGDTIQDFVTAWDYDNVNYLTLVAKEIAAKSSHIELYALASSTDGGQIAFQVGDSGDTNRIALYRGAYGNKTEINVSQQDFDTIIHGDSGAGGENLVYVDAGNVRVGIGTDAPNSKLHVNGSVNVTAGNKYKIGGSDPDGAYDPTFTAVANITSVSGSGWLYSRVGDVVTVSGLVAVEHDGSGVGTFGISLPIASNLIGAGNLSGTGASVASATVSYSGTVAADTTNDRAQMTIPQYSDSLNWRVMFQYIVR